MLQKQRHTIQAKEQAKVLETFQTPESSMKQRELQEIIEKALDQWTGCDWTKHFSWNANLPDTNAKLSGHISTKGLNGEEDIETIIDEHLPLPPRVPLAYNTLTRADQHAIRLAIQEAAVCSVSYAKKCREDAKKANQLGLQALEALSTQDLHKVHKLLQEASRIELFYGDNPTWEEPVRFVDQFAQNP